MSEVISIFEYDLLGSGKAASVGAKLVPQQVFDYLETLSLTSEQGSQFLKLTSRSGFKLLQVQNYAGMLSTPHGLQLEILPKIGKNLTLASARETFITMLSHLPRFRHIQTQQATLQAQRMPLLEIFISQFLQSVSQLLKQGLRSDYVSKQGNLAFMKGKLMLSAQLRHNAVNRHKFCVDYDEYMPDCAALQRHYCADPGKKLCAVHLYFPIHHAISHYVYHVRIDGGWNWIFKKNGVEYYYFRIIGWSKYCTKLPSDSRIRRKRCSFGYRHFLYGLFLGKNISLQKTMVSLPYRKIYFVYAADFDELLLAHFCYRVASVCSNDA